MPESLENLHHADSDARKAQVHKAGDEKRDFQTGLMYGKEFNNDCGLLTT